VPLARKLGPLDATMIVVSGIIGSGIFINPQLVAKGVETPFLILAVWVLGGVIALAGAFVFAELGTVVPRAGGQYAFFREAFIRWSGSSWLVACSSSVGGDRGGGVTCGAYLVDSGCRRRWSPTRSRCCSAWWCCTRAGSSRGRS
jgi:APA family basic amino acid/polyamine antiporter